MKKAFKQLHLWLSIPAGIFVILLCLTGAILVFQQELQRVMDVGYYYVEDYQGKSALSIDSLVNTASQVAEADGKQITSITAYAAPSRTWEVGVAGQKGSYCTLNPYTAEVTGKGSPGNSFFMDVRMLHRWLMLPGEGRQIGRLIIGISTLFLLVILISGIVVGVPKKWKQWKQFLSVKRGKKSFVWWFTSHRAFGWYCILFLFLMTATGPMWSFDWYRSGVAKLFGVDMPDGSGGKGKQAGKKSPQPANTLAWENVVQQLRRQAPDFTSINISERGATVRAERHHQRASDLYKFDRQGNITDIEYYEEMQPDRKVMGYAFLLHAGLWGGWFVKLLYFIACLGGVYLSISGYWLYWNRMKKER